jgi:hypothetical protein
VISKESKEVKGSFTTIRLHSFDCSLNCFVKEVHRMFGDEKCRCQNL